MERRSGLLTASKVLGIISAVCYGIMTVLLLVTSTTLSAFEAMTSIKGASAIGWLFAVSGISMFVLSILSVVWCSKAITYWSKEYCLKAAVGFTVLSCVTFNILVILCAVFCFIEKKKLDESGINIKGSIIITSVLGGILGIPLLLVYLAVALAGVGIGANNMDTQTPRYESKYTQGIPERNSESKDLDSIANNTQQSEREYRDNSETQFSDSTSTNEVPQEFKNALETAKLYYKEMNLSKQYTAEMLEYSGFEQDAINYAIANLE